MGNHVKTCVLTLDIPKFLGNYFSGTVLGKIFGDKCHQKYRGAEWSGVWGGVWRRVWGEVSPSRLGSLRSVVISPNEVGRSPGRERILVYFEDHRTLLFVPMCRCFEFAKQCFMLHLGQGWCLGAIPPCPNVESHLSFIIFAIAQISDIILNLKKTNINYRLYLTLYTFNKQLLTIFITIA